MNLCKCGCGELCNKTYIHGHNRKNKFHTEESIQKMSEIKKGINKGTNRSEETKQKISETLKGRVSPMKGKKAWNKGIPHTEEHKRKLSLARKGKPSSKKGKPGKPQTKESNKKRSNSLKGHLTSKETREKISASLTGHSFSEKSREKSSESHKKYFKSLKTHNQKFPYRSKPEIEFGKQIEKHFGIKLNHSKWLDGKCFDYCYETNKILIECDGRFWHNTERSKIIDKLKNNIAEDNNYILVRYFIDTPSEVEEVIYSNFKDLNKLLIGVLNEN